MNKGRKIRVMVVVGARPNFMKAAPILDALEGSARFASVLVHTGQHYDDALSRIFFSDLGIRKPDVNLNVGSASHAQQTARIMMQFEPVLVEYKPDMLLVVGDVNSTVACALVASKLGVPVGHVEAGLRSGDRAMPEEINRIVTDSISDCLFTSEPSGEKNLLAEGRPPEAIHFVGNTMIDTLLRSRERAEASPVLSTLGLEDRAYGVLTLHRPANVDKLPVLEGILQALSDVARELPIVFPAHPRTRVRLEAFGLQNRLVELDGGSPIGKCGLFMCPPMGYLDFMKMMSHARLVFSDSGGIQEETTILNVPCLTLRENTERPITVEQGTNRLVGRDPERIVREAQRVLSAPPADPVTLPYWDGKAAGRIVEVLDRGFCEASEGEAN